MERLTLLRHAKSSWDHPGLSDRERPLNGRGTRDAPLMGLVCAKELPPPDLILVSPAKRTRETIEAFTEAWNLKDVDIQVDERLYLAGIAEWVDIVEEHAADADHILGCAHQPGIGYFANWLDSGFTEAVPTAAVMSFKMNDGFLAAGSGRLTYYGIPKAYR